MNDDILEALAATPLPDETPVDETPVDETPVDETPADTGGDQAPPPGYRVCRHCGGQFAASEAICPGCGKSQRGAPRGPRQARGTEGARRVAKAVMAPPSEAEVLRAEEAIGQVFSFVCEDIIAPRMLPRGVEPPPFGEARAAKLGVVLAPALAPFMRGPYMMLLIGLVLCGHAMLSYFRDVRRLANNTQSQSSEKKVILTDSTEPFARMRT